MLLSVAVLILAQAAQTPPPQIDCAGGQARISVWDRARAPHQAKYCELLASAEARLQQEPARADEAARAAATLLPEQSAPWVFRARAAVVMKKYTIALPLFDRALALSPDALKDPRALLAHAVSLRESGETTRAIEAYRRLLPSMDSIPGEEERTRARLDAAMALMLEGAKGMDPAQAILKDAVQEGAPSLRAVAQAVSALAWERAGNHAQAVASATIAYRGGALTVMNTTSPLGWSVEALAVSARLKEVAEPSAAIASWEAYLARAGQGPWATQVRARLAELKKGGKRR